MKLVNLGAAVTLAFLPAGPALAQHVISGPDHNALSTYCATTTPGSPFGEKFDCMTWSDGYPRGAWDSRGHDARWRNPAVHHRETGF